MTKYDFMNNIILNEVFATNNPKYINQANIENGYVQILHFEKGTMGLLEVYFNLTTKPQVLDNGTKVPSSKVEGRFRIRQ